MAYRLRRDESVPEGVRRVATELVDEAIGLLDDPGDAIEASVHQVRKDCKMLRGLVRLVRPGMGTAYRRANAAFRDAARELASIRDAHALLDTFDDMIAAAGEVGGDAAGGSDASPAFAAVRAQLARRADAASAAVSAGDQRLREARALLLTQREQIAAWPLSDDLDVVRGGVAKTYRRGRRRLRDSMCTPTDELLHQWRKRVKYSWYHVRLLQDAAPSVLAPLAARLHDLSDALGDDHDLAVLTEQLHAEPEAFGGDAAVQATDAVVTRVREDLEQRAWRLGSRLYVEPADVFADRLTRYWTAWMEHGDEMAAGEIATLAPATSTDDELRAYTVTQLYATARELEIDGRSRMNRTELVAAIRAAVGTG